MTNTLPITKAREELATMVKNAKNKMYEYIITVNGSPAAVLISAEEYASWKETDEITSDKKLMKEIKEAEEDIEKGRVYDWEDVKKELEWNVPAKNHRKSKKSA